MEPELQQNLYQISAEQLAHLVEDLIGRHPSLSGEIEEMVETILKNDTSQSLSKISFHPDSLTIHHPMPRTNIQLEDPTSVWQLLDGFHSRLQGGTPPQRIFDDLVSLLQEAEQRADQYDYHLALSIYMLVLDTRLTLNNPILTAIFDRAIDEFMPVMDMLLSEVSSQSLTERQDTATGPAQLGNLDEDTTHTTLYFTSQERQKWLQRLFSLWLQRLDTHQIDENLPEIMLEVAWKEDLPLIRELITQEMEPHSSTSNIVDFSHRSRLRTLTKLLTEIHLP